MSGDRELLEKAAKAAGRGRITAYHDDGAICTATARWPHSGERWNPLVDDGDALRLAVKLGIKIELHPAWVYARAIVRGLEYLQIEEGWAHGHSDPYAATRRAIVRAAAALADATPSSDGRKA